MKQGTGVNEPLTLGTVILAAEAEGSIFFSDCTFFIVHKIYMHIYLLLLRE